MNYAMKPPLLVAQVLPGLYTLLALAVLRWIVDPSPVVAVQGQISASNSLAAVYSAVVFIVACLLGFFLDALRNGIGEGCIDSLFSDDGKWWDVFFHGDKEKVKRLNVHYFSDYVLDANILVASVFLLFYAIVLAFQYENKLHEIGEFIACVVVSGVVFFCDARSLRTEIRRLSETHLGKDDDEKPPHYGVFTRIERSEISGVGVFAIRDIPKVTKIFYGDENDEMVWIDKEKLENQESDIKKLYEDFCVVKDGKYGCPKNFNQMPISWYLNDTQDAEKLNVRCGKDYVFFALRDIKKGEELLTNYDTYSERAS